MMMMMMMMMMMIKPGSIHPSFHGSPRLKLVYIQDTMPPRAALGTQAAAMAATPGIAHAENSPNATRQASRAARLEVATEVAARDADQAIRQARSTLRRYEHAQALA
jgi:hypothetical protein